MLLITAQVGSLAQTVISPQEHTRRANEYLKANEPAKAIPELAAVVAAQPDNLDAQANLGVLLYFQARCSEAKDHLYKAIQINQACRRSRRFLDYANIRWASSKPHVGTCPPQWETSLTPSSAKK